jgi:hypothetical protein
MKAPRLACLVLLIIFLAAAPGVLCAEDYVSVNMGSGISPFVTIELRLDAVNLPPVFNTNYYFTQGVGLRVESDILTFALWHAQFSYLSLVLMLPVGFLGDAGMSLMLYGETLGIERQTPSGIVTIRENSMHLLDLGARCYFLPGFVNLSEEVGRELAVLGYFGYRYETAFNTILYPMEHFSIALYGVAGANDYDLGGGRVSPLHFVWGGILSLEWWYFHAELRYLENNIQVTLGATLALGLM